MTPQEFAAKWRRAELKERSAAQEHFIDLCHMLGEPTPAEADPTGSWYCFERGASKVGGGEGWADVWMQKHFGWEYKGKRKDLDAALVQLRRYAPALENPPLLVVSDLDRIVLHTNWTNTVPASYEIPLERLAIPENLQRLKWAFSDPDRLRPDLTTEDVTKDAAARFAGLAQRLRTQGFEAHRVAHFLNRMVFCLFAEDAGLLPANVFTRTLEVGRKNAAFAQSVLTQLFTSMHAGGAFGAEIIDWFNGGLFNDGEALPLTRDDIDEILEAAKLNWSAVEPSIFGTLFERGLDPSKRSQLGAHYTDPKTIMRLVGPVVEEPLLAEWAAIRSQIAAAMDRVKDGTKATATRNKAHREAEALHQGFLKRLADYRVLDPACGSGNFLYLALQTLKNIEHRVMLESEQLGLPMGFVGMNVGVQCVHGIELNPYAADLARLTVWIGEIQWMLRHGIPPSKNPILKDLDRIECRDALINTDGTEAAWPVADAIVGNPPFLGNKRMISELGEAYTESVRRLFGGRLPGGVDLVIYWFERARAQIEAGRCQRAGLVATQAIRKGANRAVLDRVVGSTQIFDAWRDEPWVNEGAAVRVSLIAYGASKSARLDGDAVGMIFADLTSDQGGGDLTSAKVLGENTRVVFQGTIKVGDFDISGELARDWLSHPNPTGRHNSEVLRPWANGQDLAGRSSDTWIVDFGAEMPEDEAALFETPFAHVLKCVRPVRLMVRRDGHRRYWWRHAEARPGMRKALAPLARFIATPRVAKYRFFVWLPAAVLPDSRLYAICRDDDASFGVLSSRQHEVWALANASRHGDGDEGGRPTYNARDCFETFPFPNGLTPNLKPNAYTNPHAAAIAAAAANLNTLRENWLNPPEWVDRAPEVVAGCPDRLIAKPGHEANLKKRTLTNLYNACPTWLQNAHRDLDAAVALAYGWPDYTPEMHDEEILRRLLALNLARV